VKNFRELWDQAKVQAKASNGDVFEIYAQLSGAQIVSEYKDKTSEKMEKAGYKFHLNDKFLYLTTLSGKSKIIPIYNPEYRHIFSEAGVIIENKNGFWKEFIYENFKNDENLLAVKKQFDHCERSDKIKQELKDYFGIIDVFENDDIKKIEKEIIAKNISKLNPRGDSVPFDDKYIIASEIWDGENLDEAVYITKEPLSRILIKFYEELYFRVYDFAGLEEDKVEKEYSYCSNIIEKIMKFNGIDLLFRKEYGELNRLNHFTVDTANSNRTTLADIKEGVIETLLPLVKKGGGELDFISQDFKGWSVSIRPLDKFLPFCWVFDIIKDNQKKVTCILNGADFNYTNVLSIKEIFLDAWLKQTNVIEFEKIKPTMLKGNTLFVSLQDIDTDCISDITSWIPDFERCLAFTILYNKELQ
jgi:hypothetical protein